MSEFGRAFVLNRDVDDSGVSGTGVVAWGCEFPDGTCVLRWASQHRSTAVYGSLADLETIHGHGGHTRVVFDGDIADPPKPVNSDAPIIMHGPAGALSRIEVVRV